MKQTMAQIALSVVVVSTVSPVYAIAHREPIQLPLTQQHHNALDSGRPQNSEIAGFGSLFRKTKGLVNDVLGTKEKIDNHKLKTKLKQQQLKEQKAREEERKRRAQQLAEAREAATAKELEEARLMREAFDQMSPEEKQAYVDQLQERKNQETAANLAWVGLWADLLIGGSGYDSGDSGTTNDSPVYRPTQSPTPSYNPAPSQTPVVHPNYGNCHHYSC